MASEIKKLCNKFMQKFVSLNRKNQKRAFRYIDTFMAQMGKGLGAAGTITAIFKDNSSLCRKATMDVLMAFISTIRRKKPAQGIQFLGFIKGVISTLAKSGGQSLKEKNWFCALSPRRSILHCILRILAGKSVLNSMQGAPFEAALTRR